MKTRIALSVIAVCALAATANAAHAFEISFDWGPTKKCFDGKSPPFSLRGVPDGTAKIRFRMTDLDAPGYPHGGGSVAYKGQSSLPYGAFRYKGPCPPSPHTYQFSADALDGKGKKLASAKARKRFP